MLILPVNFNSKQKNNSLNFNGVVSSSPEFIKTAQELKALPDLHCACCGMPLIANNKVNVSYLSYQLPAIEVFKKRGIAAYKGTEAYKIAIEIAKKAPNLPLSRTFIWAEKDGVLEKLRPKVREILKEIVSKTTRYIVPSKKIVYKLRPHKDFYGSPQKEIFPILQDYASRYPDLSFNEIFRIPQILDYHTQRAHKTDIFNANARQKIFGEVKELVEKYSPEDIKLLTEYNEQVNTMLYKSSRVPELRQYKIRTIYEEFLEKASGKIPREELLKKVDKLDIAGYDIDHFVVDNAQRYTDTTLIDFFLKNRIATIEHCTPVSAKGEDRRDNIIVMCAKCNHDRYSYPYEENLKVHPEMTKNVQQQINAIVSAIKSGLLKGWEEYPLGIAKQLKEASNSRIKVNVDDYIEFRRAELEKKIQEQLENLKKKPNYRDKLDNFFDTHDKITEKHQEFLDELRNIRSELMVEHLRLKDNNTSLAQEKLDDIAEINNAMHKQEEFLEEITRLSGKLKAVQKVDNPELYANYKELKKLQTQLKEFLADVNSFKSNN